MLSLRHLLQKSPPEAELDAEQFQSLLDATEMDRALLRELLDTFRGEADDAVAELAKAALKREDAEIARITHYLYGSASNIALARFAKICKTVEQGVKESRFDEYELLAAEINDAYQRACQSCEEAIGAA